MRRPVVLLADDHRPSREAYRAILEEEFQIVREVADGKALVEAYRESHPDVVVSDVAMSGLSGIAATEAILREHPAARIVLVTARADRAMMRRALAVGALGYVLKTRMGEDLLPAVRAALRYDVLISPMPTIVGRSRDE